MGFLMFFAGALVFLVIGILGSDERERTGWIIAALLLSMFIGTVFVVGANEVNRARQEAR